MKCNHLSAILVVICLFTLRTHAQEQKTPAPMMMDTTAIKKKMMEPEMMKSAQKAMMSEKSMVPLDDGQGNDDAGNDEE